MITQDECNQILKDYVNAIRTDFEKKQNYKFLPTIHPPMSDKNFHFVNKIVHLFNNLYTTCQQNKENPTYWQELTVAAASIFIAVATKSDAPKVIGAGGLAGAGIAADMKAKEAEQKQKSAVAFTKIVNVENCEKIGMNLGVHLSYRLGNIIDSLAMSVEGIDKLALFLSLQIESYILGNACYFNDDKHMLGLMLQEAVPPEDSPAYKSKFWGNDKVENSDKSSIDLSLLLTMTPAYDETGTIYYKNPDRKNLFQYPFQRLRHSEEANANRYEKFLDITESWDSLLGKDKIEKLHSGIDKISEVPSSLYDRINEFRQNIIISKNNLGTSSRITSVVERINKVQKSLVPYLEFCWNLSMGASEKTKYSQGCILDLVTVLKNGTTKNVQLVMILQQAVQTTEETQLYLNQTYPRDIQNCDMDVHSRIRMYLTGLIDKLNNKNGNGTDYKRQYISYVNLTLPMLLSSHNNKPAIPINRDFILPSSPSNSDNRVVISSHPSILYHFLQCFNPLNLNESANKLLDTGEIKDENIRIMLKTGAAVLVIASGGVAYWFFPMTALKTVLIVEGCLGLTLNTYSQIHEYKKKWKEYSSNIGLRSEKDVEQGIHVLDEKKALDDPMPNKRKEHLNKVSVLENYVNQMINGSEKDDMLTFIASCNQGGSENIPYMTEKLKKEILKFKEASSVGSVQNYTIPLADSSSSSSSSSFNSGIYDLWDSKNKVSVDNNINQNIVPSGVNSSPGLMKQFLRK